MGDIGRIVGGRYRIDRELGADRGTQSLLVTDLRNGRPCVLRQICVAAASPAAARRFEAQVAILARLDHSGLPRFIDAFSEGEGDAAVRAVVTGYHPGENLERLVAKDRPLGEAQALVLARRLVKILTYLHSFEPPLVHRGIKATGIVLGPDGRPCITDLDYAAAEPAVLANEHAPPGPDELALAAPEVFMDGAVPASDLYALGLALCRGMTAKDVAGLLRDGVRGQLRGALGVSEAFAAVLARMLEPSLEKRYPDARALDADLARLSGGWVAPVHQAAARKMPARAVEEPRPPRRIRPLLLAGVAVALVALTVVAVRMRHQPPPETSLIVSPEQPALAPAPEAAAPTAAPSVAAEATVPPTGAANPAEPPVPVAPPTPTLAPAPPTVPAAPPAAALGLAVATAPVVSGRLLFDGKLFAPAAAPALAFWFRDEGTRKEVKPQVEGAAGAFTIRGLAPGRYALSVRIDHEPGNPKTFPGDLTAWEEFTLEAGQPAALDVSLRTVMHLMQPVDNGVVIPGWDTPCGAGNVHPGKVVFSWASLGPGTRYDVSVERLACGRGYASAGKAFAESTGEAWVKLDLPPNREGECYAFRLTANRNGRTIGIMNTHGKTGIGWDYRFTVSK